MTEYGQQLLSLFVGRGRFRDAVKYRFGVIFQHRQVVKQGGYDSGFLFFSRVGIGDWDDHFSKNEGPDVYYNAFMLY